MRGGFPQEIVKKIETGTKHNDFSRMHHHWFCAG